MLDRLIAQASVNKGAGYLDRACPFWYIAVCRELDVSRVHGCLIGQLYPQGFHKFLKSARLSIGWAIDNGFYVDDPDDYDVLNTLWQQKIDERLDPRYCPEGVKPIGKPKFRRAVFRPFSHVRKGS